MYKPLFVNVSVSLIVSGVQPHMTIGVKLEQNIETMLHYMKFAIKYMTTEFASRRNFEVDVVGRTAIRFY